MHLNTLNIVMVGDSLKRQGGIVTVEKLIIQQAPPHVHIKHIATLVSGSTINRAFGFGQGLGQLLWTLLRTKVDLVHIHLSDGGSTFRKAIVALIAFIFCKPAIMHAHGPEFHLFYAKLHPWIQRGVSWVYCRCVRFVVLSESWKNYYVKNLGLEAKRVVVLPNPVKLPSQVPHRANSNKAKVRDTPEFNSVADSNFVSFVFLGRIGERKGTYDLIKAFAALPQQQKMRAELVIAGDGDLAQVRRLIASLNLIQDVTVHDWLNSEERDALLASSDVFVLPSYNEGLPMSILEAMSWGLPIITTPVGGIPELVTHKKNGLLVQPGNIQNLSEAMLCLIEDESLRLDMGGDARLSVAPYDIKNYLSSLLSIYDSVLNLREETL